MTRSDWLLLFVASAAGRPVAPVRVQKGLFLLAMSGALPREERYEFEPYNYGPMSRELYRDVRGLCERGLTVTGSGNGFTWRTVAPTRAGRRRAARLRARARLERPDALLELTALRSRVDALSFPQLLALVYDRHPEYAVRSVFRRP